MIATLLAATVGGAAGAIVRGFCTTHLKRHTPAWFPFPTLIINALACFALGALMATSPTSTRAALLATGFLGGFSTMSTFSFETVEAIAHGQGLKHRLRVRHPPYMSWLLPGWMDPYCRLTNKSPADTLSSRVLLVRLWAIVQWQDPGFLVPVM